MSLPSLDPLWTSVFVAFISAIVTIVLVIITYLYLRQTKRMADTAQLSFLYERKPHLTFLIYNKDNRIFFSIRNNEKIITSVKNIDAELTIKLDDEAISIGMYHIKGPLLPGEEEIEEITHILIDILRERKLIIANSAQTPDTDDAGYPYFPTVYYLQKYEIEFEIRINLSFELDIESLTKQSFPLKRIFNIRLYSAYGSSYYEPPDEDNYLTDITMKIGEWIQSRDYLINKPKKIKKNPSV